MTGPYLYATIFMGFLLLAARSDAADLRIPNRLVLVMALAALPVGWLLGIGLPMFAAVITGAATLAVTWAMFEMGWLGGGDAKLAAATALWLGPPGMAIFVIATALFGAILAVALLCVSRWELARGAFGARWEARLTAEAISVPYALAMAPGGAVAMAALLPSLT